MSPLYLVNIYLETRMESWYEARKIWLYLKHLVCNTLYKELKLSLSKVMLVVGVINAILFMKILLNIMIISNIGMCHPKLFIPRVFHYKIIFYVLLTNQLVLLQSLRQLYVVKVVKSINTSFKSLIVLF